MELQEENENSQDIGQNKVQVISSPTPIYENIDENNRGSFVTESDSDEEDAKKEEFYKQQLYENDNYIMDTEEGKFHDYEIMREERNEIKSNN